ncbi:FAD-dependent oxidoreductase [Virgisporangium ochraceum]|uniref:FAD-dependent oxidoreductase n=1 Tax=Virgisporangium ochraceum TaxID=65505 RepID=A0A8J3ZVT5_9ACTN|nr:NAD(P)/FAD-dependent oxidoreductase [Virgisporangium ochraceum]GIJ70904.1 FAD-dependent oxidoreductase [Virgisporangium ochraceum]
MTTHDVVVVGARAAGSAVAGLLARLGHDVAVVDRADPRGDTVSTHHISRTGMVALHRWGLLDELRATGAPELRELTFHRPEGTVTRPLRPSQGIDHLLAPRRYVLDGLLAEAAVRSGARLRTGLTVAGVRRDGSGRVTGVHGPGVELSARFVVGADGLHSRIARSVGAAMVGRRPDGGQSRYAYYAGLSRSGIEFFLTDGALAGIFPTHDGEACVWICTPAGTGDRDLDALVRRFAPGLARRLRDGRRTSPVSGMMRSPNHLRAAWGAGWALIGDAGFHRDPISAHGISDAFRDADILAGHLDAVLRGRADERAALGAFQQYRDAAVADIFDVTCALGTFPPVTGLADLMRRLGRAVDTEAAALAAAGNPEAAAPAAGTEMENS